jgi:hypothetical protein
MAFLLTAQGGEEKGVTVQMEELGFLEGDCTLRSLEAHTHTAGPAKQWNNRLLADVYYLVLAKFNQEESCRIPGS